MAAKELVCSRSILKVGDGEMIKVWTDPWIPAGEDFKVSSPVVPGLEEARVRDFFRAEVKEWDYDLILNSFNLEDARNILKIPLSVGNRMDSWMWVED